MSDSGQPPETSKPPAGFYPDSSGAMRWWDGNAWTDRMQQSEQPPPPAAPAPAAAVTHAPEKKSHTLRNVLLGITALFVLTIGGCLALLGGTVNEIDKSVKEHETKAGGSKNPINVNEGEAFTIGDNDYLGGWRLKNNVLGEADVAGLKVTNNSDEADFPDIEFRFFKGKEELAEVSCGLLKEVQPGTTAKIECSGDQPLPKKWDNLTVQNSI